MTLGGDDMSGSGLHRDMRVGSARPASRRQGRGWQMALRGQGVLAIWNGIADEAEAAFLAWHVREHMPERVGVPGFLRGRRYAAQPGTPHRGRPDYFNFYETADVSVLSSPGYVARLNAPSDWTRAVVPHFRDTSRTVCRVAASLGRGDGGWIGTIRMDAPPAAPGFVEAMVGEMLAPALAAPGIVAVHLLQGEPAASSGATAEKAMRTQPDEVVGWIVLIEATGPAPLADVLDSRFDATGLSRLGASDARAGIYGLQFGLDRQDIE